MEINATVFAAADDPELLAKAGNVLEEMLDHGGFMVQVMEPDAVLPLSRTWYGFRKESGMTSGPEYWMPCLRECARLLGRNGIVFVEFRSPDHPDTYEEYAWTTPGGDAGYGLRGPMIGYRAALGNSDAETVVRELRSGRTEYERRRAVRRLEKKEALRAEKGDFEIVNGTLKKYRGTKTRETIPEGVTEIGESAFVDLNSLERYMLSDEDYDAPALEELVIPEGVVKIGSYALAYCMNLKSVTIPDSVASIGSRAFEGCEELESIVLPRGLAGIEDNTFFLCTALRSAVIPEGVKKIGEGAFRDCDSLKSIILPAGVEEIEANAFLNCGSLKHVLLPEGLKRVGANAFSGCESLEEIRLPRSLAETGRNAFDEACWILRAD